MKTFLVALCLSMGLLESVRGHGRMIEPPSRATMWRFGYNTKPDYNDNQGFCGGFAEQFNEVNQGRCGICGDEWSKKREHEAGGTYGSTEILVGNYTTGQWIPVQIEITANHLGYFTFKLCPTNDWSHDRRQDCFDENVLSLYWEGKDHGDAMPPANSDATGVYDVHVKLPEDVECDQCVLQWTYTAGNSWGRGGICGEGVEGMGCGDQETFRACADIRITRDDNVDGGDNEVEEGTTTAAPTTTQEEVEETTTEQCTCTCP